MAEKMALLYQIHMKVEFSQIAQINRFVDYSKNISAQKVVSVYEPFLSSRCSVIDGTPKKLSVI